MEDMFSTLMLDHEGMRKLFFHMQLCLFFFLVLAKIKWVNHVVYFLQILFLSFNFCKCIASLFVYFMIIFSFKCCEHVL